MGQRARSQERGRRKRSIRALKLRAAERETELARIADRKRRVLERVRAACERGRVKVRLTIARLEREEREKLNARKKALREAARERCQARRKKAKRAARSTEHRKRLDAAHLRKQADELAHANAQSWTAADLRANQRKKEKRSEAESFVLQDIPDELHDVYRAVRSKLPPPTRHKDGTIRTSKAERFFEWVEENPDVVLAIKTRAADREVSRLVKEREREERALQKLETAKLRKAKQLEQREAVRAEQALAKTVRRNLGAIPKNQKTDDGQDYGIGPDARRALTELAQGNDAVERLREGHGTRLDVLWAVGTLLEGGHPAYADELLGEAYPSLRVPF